MWREGGRGRGREGTYFPTLATSTCLGMENVGPSCMFMLLPLISRPMMLSPCLLAPAPAPVS